MKKFSGNKLGYSFLKKLLYVNKLNSKKIEIFLTKCVNNQYFFKNAEISYILSGLFVYFLIEKFSISAFKKLWNLTSFDSFDKNIKIFNDIYTIGYYHIVTLFIDYLKVNELLND